MCAAARQTEIRHGVALLREAFQGCAGHLAEEYDLVVIARPQLLELVAREGEGEKGAVGAAVRELLERAGLLTGGTP